jgi:hypothetical protein
MWVFVFILLVIVLFYPRDKGTEPFINNLTEDYQRSRSDKEPTEVKDYFEKPAMNCPQN